VEALMAPDTNHRKPQQKEHRMRSTMVEQSKSRMVLWTMKGKKRNDKHSPILWVDALGVCALLLPVTTNAQTTPFTATGGIIGDQFVRLIQAP
jgi:hypothetical protein